jgi:hypothetical protein
MKWLAMAALSLTLLGCRADQQREAARCELEVQRTYPNVQNSYMSVPAGEFIELCMRAAGYDFDSDNPNCENHGAFVLSEKPNPFCYVPDSELGRIGQKLEGWLRR